jgi:hypothetical protein
MAASKALGIVSEILARTSCHTPSVRCMAARG